MQFTKLGLAKLVASTVVGIGAGKIVAGVIKTHIKPENLFDKITMAAGAWAIGGIVTQATKQYTNDMIDETVAAVSEQIENMKLKQKIGRIDRNESTFEEEGLNPNDYEKNDGGMWEFVGEKTPDFTDVEEDSVVITRNDGGYIKEKTEATSTAFEKYQAGDKKSATDK